MITFSDGDTLRALDPGELRYPTMAPSDKDPASSEPSKDAIKPAEASDVEATKPADTPADPKPDDNQAPGEGSQESTTTEFDEDEYSESDDDFPQFEGGQPRGKANPPVSGSGGKPARPPRPVR